MRYLLALLLFACAPAEYQRGTPARPAPAPARPGVGAPTPGQPGTLGHPRDYPRSPHKRILPTTREPGLWSTQEPTASASDGDVKVFGVPLPLTSERHKNDPRHAHLRRCAEELVAITSKEVELVADMHRDDVTCLVATINVECMNTRYKRALEDRARLKGEAYKLAAGPIGVLGAATQEARRLYNVACKDDMMSSAAFILLRNSLLNDWKEQFGGK